MSKTVIASFKLTCLLFTAFLVGLAVNIQPANASGTVYIRADGSMDPPTANITTLDMVTYTFTGDIFDEIVVERSNIVVDGMGHTVEGTGNYSSKGFYLSGVFNVTVTNTNIKHFHYGIELYSSSKSSVSGNNVANNWAGIELYSSSNNSVSGNNVTTNNYYGIELYSSSNNGVSGNNVANNRYGIRLYSSSNNSVYGNNVANNRYGIRLDSSSNNVFYHNFVSNSRQAYNEESANVWDLGYPFGGNYWSDFSGVDLHSGPYQNGTGYDWIGDTAYVIDANNADRYPLTHPFDPQTDDAKIAYRNLLTEYNGLRSDFEKMNSTCYGLLADYATLSHNVDQLAEDLDALNSSYYQHLQDYSGLQANHTSLQNNYNNLLTAFAALNSSYTSLKADYNALNTSYNSLNTSLTDYQQTTQNELTNVKNMLYAFVAVTVILAAAIVYMATRKPKTKPET